VTTYAAPSGSDYYRYVKPPTTGVITPLIMGRDSNGTGPNIDSTEPLDAMQAAVQALGSGDAVFLSAWMFTPDTALTAAYLSTNTTWGQLFAAKAGEGVIVRILINDFDPVAGGLQSQELSNLSALDALVTALPSVVRDNLKYVVCRHPATISALTTWIAQKGWSRSLWRTAYPGSHHQKFMVVRHGDEFTVFCGGVDIELRKAPILWNTNGGWHDVHVKLEGPITRDLEQEFVMRWNMSIGANLRAPIAGWAGYDTLFLHKLSAIDGAPAKTVHDVQMLRTISMGSDTLLFSNTRSDIQEAYKAGIARATKFIYMENQYFRVPSLAGWLLNQKRAHPDLVIVIVVVASAGNDDGNDPVTAQGDYLQFQTFQALVQGIDAAHLRLYTMTGRMVHAKLIMVDDAWMCVGSANVNPRGFLMDSELNIQTSAAGVVSSFRTRLWAHNLGVSAPTVAGWGPSDFIARWDAVATSNAALGLDDMAGEGIVAYDYTSRPGKASAWIPEQYSELDLSLDNSYAALSPAAQPSAVDANDAPPATGDPTV